MTAQPLQFVPPAPPFMAGRAVAALAELEADAALFGAPHGTPYPGIDNRVHAASAAALRAAMAGDSAWLDHWDFDLEGSVFAGTKFRLADLGDLATISEDGPGNRAKIEAVTRGILLRHAVPIMIGGDDSVPIPFLAGFAEHGPITIVQVDAHIDWRQEREGERFGYSSTMRRASEMAHVERIIQVGIRGLGSARAGEVEDARAWGALIVPARTIHERGVSAALELVPNGAAVVLTVDCDALDSGIMPAVMAPTLGGVAYPQMLDLIAGLNAKARLVGMDLIEFVPERDPFGAYAYTAARLIWHAVGHLARRAR